MAKKSVIETKLLKLTGVKPKPGEEQNKYLARLNNAAQEKIEKDEDIWETLDEGVQNWINATTTALEEGKEPLNFPDVEQPKAKAKAKSKAKDEEEEAEDEEEEESKSSDDEEAEEETDTETDPDKEESEGEDEEEEEDKPVKKTAKPKKVHKAEKSTKKEAAPKKAAKAEEKKPTARKSSKSGAQQMIKKLILKQPDISTDQIIEKLEKSGLKPSRLAVSSIRSGFRDSLRVIQDAGHLKEALV